VTTDEEVAGPRESGTLGPADPLAVAADVDVTAFAARANPVAKLGVGLAVAVAMVLSLDVVTAGTALALELAALPWCGLGPAALWRRLRMVLLAGTAAGLGTGLFGVAAQPWVAGAAVTLRILAVALPGVVLLATTDPTDLADALAQVLHLPHRFVLSALAATRLAGVLAQEWEVIGLARRARGLGDEGPGGRVRAWLGRVFALLVIAVRRATVLAIAMEARGFGVTTRRTWARPSRLRGRDAVVLGYGLLVAAVATAAGVRAGTWHLLAS
jgi:energy-coupling factor transport system permease protein